MEAAGRPERVDLRSFERQGIQQIPTVHLGPAAHQMEKHCEAALELVKNKKEEHKIVILRSWNEWGEGNYVEPDEQWGTAFLDVLRDVFVEK